MYIAHLAKYAIEWLACEQMKKIKADGQMLIDNAIHCCSQSTTRTQSRSATPRIQPRSVTPRSQSRSATRRRGPGVALV